MEKLYYNNIYFEIKIGTPEQRIPMFIRMREYSSFITSQNFNGSISKFNYLSGIIGLKLSPNENNLAEKYSLITLLKEKKLINDYSFSLKYNYEKNHFVQFQ